MAPLKAIVLPLLLICLVQLPEQHNAGSDPVPDRQSPKSKTPPAKAPAPANTPKRKATPAKPAPATTPSSPKRKITPAKAPAPSTVPDKMKYENIHIYIKNHVSKKESSPVAVSVSSKFENFGNASLAYNKKFSFKVRLNATTAGAPIKGKFKSGADLGISDTHTLYPLKDDKLQPARKGAYYWVIEDDGLYLIKSKTEKKRMCRWKRDAVPPVTGPTASLLLHVSPADATRHDVSESHRSRSSTSLVKIPTHEDTDPHHPQNGSQKEAHIAIKQNYQREMEKQEIRATNEEDLDMTSRRKDRMETYDDDDNKELNNGSVEQNAGPPLMALNHVSRLCRSVKASIEFYTKVLGFVMIERPPAFDFDGAWLFNYGIGIHLVQSKDEDKLPHSRDELDPMDNHISFQCEDMRLIEQKLKECDVKYMKRTVEDDQSGTTIDQLFFNDPDGFMVEICNCENLKLVPAGSLGKVRLPMDRHNPPLELEDDGAN